MSSRVICEDLWSKVNCQCSNLTKIRVKQLDTNMEKICVIKKLPSLSHMLSKRGVVQVENLENFLHKHYENLVENICLLKTVHIHLPKEKHLSIISKSDWPFCNYGFIDFSKYGRILTLNIFHYGKDKVPQFVNLKKLNIAWIYSFPISYLRDLKLVELNISNTSISMNFKGFLPPTIKILNISKSDSPIEDLIYLSKAVEKLDLIKLTWVKNRSNLIFNTFVNLRYLKYENYSNLNIQIDALKNNCKLEELDYTGIEAPNIQYITNLRTLTLRKIASTNFSHKSKEYSNIEKLKLKKCQDCDLTPFVKLKQLKLVNFHGKFIKGDSIISLKLSHMKFDQKFIESKNLRYLTFKDIGCKIDSEPVLTKWKRLDNEIDKPKRQEDFDEFQSMYLVKIAKFEKIY